MTHDAASDDGYVHVHDLKAKKRATDATNTLVRLADLVRSGDQAAPDGQPPVALVRLRHAVRELACDRRTDALIVAVIAMANRGWVGTEYPNCSHADGGDAHSVEAQLRAIGATANLNFLVDLAHAARNEPVPSDQLAGLLRLRNAAHAVAPEPSTDALTAAVVTLAARGWTGPNGLSLAAPDGP